MERYVGKPQKEPGHQTRDTASPIDNVRSPEPGDMEGLARSTPILKQIHQIVNGTVA
jgi:hypothetical protein